MQKPKYGYGKKARLIKYTTRSGRQAYRNQIVGVTKKDKPLVPSISLEEKKSRYYFNSDTIDQKIKEDKTIHSFANHFNQDTKKLTSEREEVWNKITTELMSGVPAYKPNEIKEAYFTGGGPASGKGYFPSHLKEFYGDGRKRIIIDPDEIKNKLYSFDTDKKNSKIIDQKTTEFYHEESSLLSKYIYQKSLEGNYPVLLDKCHCTPGSLRQEKILAENNGYKCKNRIYLETDSFDNELIKNDIRSMTDKEGIHFDKQVNRQVPIRQVLDSHLALQDNLDEIVGIVEDTEVYKSNDFETQMEEQVLLYKNGKIINKDLWDRAKQVDSDIRYIVDNDLASKQVHTKALEVLTRKLNAKK